ncbi:hypothetical protein NHU_04101 [Rhodovulum sulfidophilum]|uniref:Response regulatory domain-containing protein n=1 Tax=Rhodovulum sulfidophilum TaxID=35806 RepID=A0A0D6B7Z6_RHOSU|nr:hypothetical protein NHU_04101 [Rhodovulum sulfidophilum]
MNLDFGILWIEDSFSEEEETSLRRRVAEAGFICRITNMPNSEGIEGRAKENRLFHRYDLILLDYRLADENGDEIAPKIRDLFPATTILFYSGTVDGDALRRLIAEKRVEGVFCIGRDRFIERTGSLIDQTASSLNRLSGMRGLAMRVVAECDDIMRHAVLEMTDHEPDCSEKLADLDGDVVNFFDGSKKVYLEATKGTIHDRLNTRAVDSGKLFKHFRRLTKVVTAKPHAFGLDEVEVDRMRELRKSTSKYDPKVLKKRNILGHVTEIETENGWQLSGSDEVQNSDFSDLRQVFAAHIRDFSEMRDIICRKIRQKTD